MTTSPGQPLIFAVSDYTGGTAEVAARAALAQFSGPGESQVRLFPRVLDRRAVETVLAAARMQGALVVYTMVQPDLKQCLKETAEELDVPSVDLMGPLVTRLAEHLGRPPRGVPGLGHETDAQYFKRIDAVEFTGNNDDGKEPRNLRKAELVFLGVSRSGKTPLSHYLAQRGFKVANVPIVLDVPLPRELEEVDPRRVFGLLIDPLALMKIRQSRIPDLGLDPGNAYGQIQHIRRELDYARRLYDAHPGWTVLDITRKAVEETATAVLQVYRECFEPVPPAPPPAPRAPAPAAPPAPPAPGPSGKATKPAARKRGR